MLVRNPGAEIWLSGSVLLRGERREFRVRVDRKPELLAAIARLAGRTEVDWRELEVSLETKLALTAMGLVVKPEEVVEVPAFRCEWDGSELAGEIRYGRNGAPVALPPGAGARMDLRGETLWAADARAGLMLPVSVPDGTIAKGVVGGVGRAPLDLEALRAELDEHGTAVLRDLLPPLQGAALARYLRELYAGGALEKDKDPGFPQRWIAHNEPVVRMLHEPLVRVVSEVTRAPVKASYCFLARYAAGASMPKHVDREQCVWNMSFVLEADPEPATEADAWPLMVEERGRVRAAGLRVGDAVLYRGVSSPHWRDALAAGSYTVAFFHFVDESFAGSLD